MEETVVGIKVVVSTRGRVTIPKQLRDELGFRGRQLIEIREDELGRLVMQAVDDESGDEHARDAGAN